MSTENNAHNLLSEQSQAWLEAVLKHTLYCHYFAVGINGDEPYPMGAWHAPFYSIEEAMQFKNEMQIQHPDSGLHIIEGMLCADSAMREAPNQFWATWQNKHKQRLENLDANKKAVTL